MFLTEKFKYDIIVTIIYILNALMLTGNLWTYENFWVNEQSEYQLEEWVWRVEKSNLTRLYERYKFLQLAEYDTLRWLLEEAGTDIEFIWEWVNWLVITHPNDQKKVIKVWKPQKDDIYCEFQTHNEIFNALRILRGIEWLGIDESVRVPRIIYEKWNNFLEMEKVTWQTFKTKFYLDIYNVQLWKLWIDEKVLSVMWDAELDQVLKDNNLQRLASPNNDHYTENEEKLENEYCEWWDDVYESPKLEKVRDVVDLIWIGSEEELFILDRNAWNIMETSDWKMYLIDFGHLD